MECFVLKKNSEKEKITLSTDIFNLKYNEQLIHQIIVSYIANSHKGVKKQKSRSEVSGGGKKPWKQKGTGRARAGSIRSPLWRGGGKIFAATGIKQKLKKINKKMYKLGLKIILSQLLRDDKLTFIDNILLNDNKTKTFLNEINFIKNTKNTLIILEEINLNLYLATRNLKNITIIDYKKINPFLLLKFNLIIISKSTIQHIEDRLK
jgi:large subunit ribosomal protein L4